MNRYQWEKDQMHHTKVRSLSVLLLLQKVWSKYAFVYGLARIRPVHTNDNTVLKVDWTCHVVNSVNLS